jgi:gas vesicle protein
MNKANALLLIVTGVAIGALGGILLAPRKGEKTRKKMMKHAKDIADDVKGKISTASQRLMTSVK